MLLKIIEIVGAIALIVSIFKVVDSYKWWLLYIFASIFYVITMLKAHLYWYVCVGIILLCTGIRNYLKGRKDK